MAAGFGAGILSAWGVGGGTLLLLGNAAVTPLVCLVVCLTILFVVVFAKCVGCSLPLLAEKVGLDPAVMASPFISTIVDATSLLIYFSFASALLGI